MIQGTGRISFLIEHYWKSTPYRPLLQFNLFTLQLEAGRGGSISENDYTETQQWIHTDSWVQEVRKFMSTNQINISHLGAEVSTQRMHDASLLTHLWLEGDFTTSELWAINRCRISKGVFFIFDISNHQGTHIQQSATNTVTNFNLIH